MGKYTEYEVPLKSLSVGSHEFDYHLGKQFFANMESQEVHDADIHVHLTLEHRNDAYDLNFKLEGTVTLLCDRCLDELIWPIETGYHIVVKYGDSYSDEADDFLQIPESDNTLNVAYMLYDTVELAIPMKHVHPLGKCNRAMSTLLKKHRHGGEEDAELEQQLIDEIDSVDAPTPDSPADPRWDKLRDFNEED